MEGTRMTAPYEVRLTVSIYLKLDDPAMAETEALKLAERYGTNPEIVGVWRLERRDAQIADKEAADAGT